MSETHGRARTNERTTPHRTHGARSIASSPIERTSIVTKPASSYSINALAVKLSILECRGKKKKGSLRIREIDESQLVKYPLRPLLRGGNLANPSGSVGRSSRARAPIVTLARDTTDLVVRRTRNLSPHSHVSHAHARAPCPRRRRR